MWLIGTYQECLAYDVIVMQGEQYYNGDNWANPIELESGQWAILKHENYDSILYHNANPIFKNARL